MKRSRILNKYLNLAIADLGHTDYIVISDAGFPVPDDSKRIDLAMEKDVPTITQVLELILSDFIYERCIVAVEQKDYNPLLFDRIVKLCSECDVETIPHEEFIHQMTARAKYIVRTGSFEPWGNLALVSGVNAPVWFEKEGTVAPNYYQDRITAQRGGRK